MKKLLITILCLAGLGTGISSCKHEIPIEPKNTDGTLVMKITPTAGGNPFAFNSQFSTLAGQNYDLSQLNFYMGNIYLVAQDNSLVSLKDIVYVELSKPITPPYDSTVIGDHLIFNVKAGTYKAIQYGLGVPANLNGTKDSTFNPNRYPNDHPLSAYRGTAWPWAGGYMFAIIEGSSYDSTGQRHSLIYHPATDPLYTPVTMPLNLTVKSGETATLNLTLDVNKIFYQQPGDLNNIDLINEGLTKMEGDNQIKIARKLIHNLSTALVPVQ
jgi:hypothetical protein